MDLLPVELLAYIIALAVRSSDVDQVRRGSLDRDGRFLFTVLHVCTRWKAIAYSTPSLWTTALLKSNRRFRRGLMSFKSRCGRLPLHLDLFISREHHFYGFSLLSAKDDNPHSYVRSVRVIGKVECEGMYFKAVRRVGLMTGAVTIERLELVITGRMYNSLYPYLGGPLARAVSAYSYLRTLSLVAFNVMACLDEEGLGLLPECRLPRLEELFLIDCDIYALQILRILVTPVLVTLGIKCHTSSAHSQQEILRQPVSHLQTVRNLALYDFPSSADVRSLLSSSPDVVNLALCNSPPRRNVEELLARHAASILPNITHLVLQSQPQDLLRVKADWFDIIPSHQRLELLGKSQEDAVSATLLDKINVELRTEEDMMFEEVLDRLRLSWTDSGVAEAKSSQALPSDVVESSRVWVVPPSDTILYPIYVH